ncbi:MAG TPA: hypothetical protein VFJ09_11845 [Nocardioidaceae bacterium]|nr:hypothetical protein [Nocardioidaceae bacterium]
MNATARITAAVAGGYLLGRTKKLKLAITVGSMLAGQRISTNPRELLRQGAQLIESNPELAKLSDQVRSQLLQALRAAAVSTASDSMNQLSDAIHNRTERLAVTQGENGSGEEEPEDEAAPDEPEDEEPEDEEPEDDASDEEGEDEQPTARKRPAKRSGGSDAGRSSRRRPAKKKAPTRQSTAKKQASKKATKKTGKKSSASRSAKG